MYGLKWKELLYFLPLHITFFRNTIQTQILTVDCMSSDILSRNEKSATMQDQSQGRTRRVFRLVRALRRVKTLRPVLLCYEM
jgi:hypothetical protein